MPKGDCFEANGRYFMDEYLPMYSSPDRLELVHAEVGGQGTLAGRTLAHCWIENLDTGFALDVSNDRFVALPIETYRRVARVDELGNEVRYSFEGFQRKILATGHWGPWDLSPIKGE